MITLICEWNFASALARIMSIGPSRRGLPTERPMEANWSFPWSLYRAFMQMTLSLHKDLSSCSKLVYLWAGSIIVCAMLSSTQPRIYLLWLSHVPLATSLFSEIDGSIFLPVTAGLGNMLVIACSRQPCNFVYVCGLDY